MAAARAIMLWCCLSIVPCYNRAKRQLFELLSRHFVKYNWRKVGNKTIAECFQYSQVYIWSSVDQKIILAGIKGEQPFSS